jgi:hypothetical protein
MQRLWRDVSSLLPLACSACSLIEPRLPAQRWHHPQGDLPTWSLIEKMPYSWISWRHFPNWSSFLCDSSSLCQVDAKLASTVHNNNFLLLLLLLLLLLCVCVCLCVCVHTCTCVHACMGMPQNNFGQLVLPCYLFMCLVAEVPLPTEPSH